MKNRCDKENHKLEPRYDEIPMPQPGGFEITNCSLEQVRRLLIRKVYVHDICVRCGKVVRRGE